MKIDIDQNSAYEETSVTIRCARLSREVTDLLALLRVYDEKLTGQRGGETHILNAADVLYADTWAKRCARAAIRTLGKKPKTGLKR